MDPSRPCREALDIVPVSVTVRREILKTEASYGGVGNSPEAIDGCTAGRCKDVLKRVTRLARLFFTGEGCSTGS